MVAAYFHAITHNEIRFGKNLVKHSAGPPEVLLNQFISGNFLSPI